MSPLRLVIIGILLYIAYRLLFGKKHKKNPAEQQKKEKTYFEMPVNDVLVEDPVCKKLVPKQQALQHHHEDQIIYFCSKECCQKFISLQGENK